MAEEDPLQLGVSNRRRRPGTTNQDRFSAAGRIAQRSQAASGTQGTTLGDNSGTGVNSPGGTINFGNTQQGPSGERAREASFDLLDRLDRQARRGAISARSAGNIAARVLGDTQSTDANRFRTTTGAQTDLAGQQTNLQRTREQIAGGFRETLARNATDLERAQIGRQTDLDVQSSRENIADANRTLGVAELAERQRSAQALEAARAREIDISRNRLGLDERVGDATISNQQAIREAEERRLDQAEDAAKFSGARETGEFRVGKQLETLKQLEGTLRDDSAKQLSSEDRKILRAQYDAILRSLRENPTLGNAE